MFLTSQVLMIKLSVESLFPNIFRVYKSKANKITEIYYFLFKIIFYFERFIPVHLHAPRVYWKDPFLELMKQHT